LHSSVLAGNGEALQIIQSEDSATAKVIRINSTGRDDAVNSMLTLRAFTKAPPKQLVAYEAGFAILYEDGTVATLGDPRYPECLGRDITPGMYDTQKSMV
jgi:predicted metal-dependent phosphoesterase TrpH